MSRWVTVAEGASILGVTERTLRRHIQLGKRASRMVDGTRLVEIDDPDPVMIDPDERHDPVSGSDHDPDMIPIRELLEEKQQRITALEREIEFLQGELTASREEVEKSRLRSDTIIQQMSQQLDRAQLALEDMSKRRTVWQRVKAVFATEIG